MVKYKTKNTHMKPTMDFIFLFSKIENMNRHQRWCMVIGLKKRKKNPKTKIDINHNLKFSTLMEAKTKVQRKHGVWLFLKSLTWSKVQNLSLNLSLHIVELKKILKSNV